MHLHLQNYTYLGCWLFLVSNRSKALLRVLAAIVLGGAVMSEAFAFDDAAELRTTCEDNVKCFYEPDSCSSDERFLAIQCISYIDGFRDGHNYGMFEGAQRPSLTFEEISQQHGIVCVPQKASNIQLVEVFIKFINEYPEYLHQEPEAALYLSWLEAFPCE